MRSILPLAAAAALFSTNALCADGKVVYGQTCAVCHATGVGGAPKLGDKAAWSARTGAGKDALVAAVIKGKGAMPPKAGNASLTEADIRVSVDYMLEQLR